MTDDALIRSACIRAAAASWYQTNLTSEGATDPKIVADNIVKFAAMLYEAWTKIAPPSGAVD